MAKRPRRSKPDPWMRGARDHDLRLGNSGSNPLFRWRDGVAIPLIMVIYGFFPLRSGRCTLLKRGTTVILEGGSARAFGIAAIALGACLHFYYYWGPSEKLSDYSRPAICAGALVFVGMLAYIAYSGFFGSGIVFHIP